MARDDLWTETEKTLARHLRTQRICRKRIASVLGKTDSAIKSFFERDRPPREPVQHVITEPSVFAARDRRSQERAEMSAAALLMGEPPPSQSALAKRG